MAGIMKVALNTMGNIKDDQVWKKIAETIHFIFMYLRVLWELIYHRIYIHPVFSDIFHLSPLGLAPSSF